MAFLGLRMNVQVKAVQDEGSRDGCWPCACSVSSRVGPSSSEEPCVPVPKGQAGREETSFVPPGSSAGSPPIPVHNCASQRLCHSELNYSELLRCLSSFLPRARWELIKNCRHYGRQKEPPVGFGLSCVLSIIYNKSWALIT